MPDHNKIYLFVHIIWCVNKRAALLGRPIRHVLFAHIQKNAEEKGTRILTINGMEDHVHCLLQLHATQNLAQVTRVLKTESSDWVNDNKLLSENFEWEEGYAAYSVSPGALKQVRDYILKQEEYHKTKTVENELEVFEKIQVPD